MWKNYRGGTISRIWVMDLSDKSVTEIPKPEGGSNDTQPQWINGKVYFRSDRNGEFNIYEYDPGSKAVRQLTRFDDFPVLALNSGAGRLIFEQAGYLHEMNPAEGQSRRIDLTINTDIIDVRPYWVSGGENVRHAGASPSGKRVVADFRGEVVTAPVKNGDVMNLTNTSGVHETHPRWSPDGKTIAYFSDASGEYALHLYDSKAKKARAISLSGTGFYAFPHWSPDSKRIAFVDNGRNLYLLEVASGKVIKVDQDEAYFPGDYRDLFGSWSKDGNWLAYSKITGTNFERAYIHNVKTGENNLYLSVSTDAGPVVNWFQQSSNDMRVTNDIYLLTLQKETVSPLVRRNDMEEIADDDEEGTFGKLSGAADAGAEKEAEEQSEDKEDDLKIDFDGLETRIIHLPIGNGNYYNLEALGDGELLYISRTDEGTALHKYSLSDREDKELMPASWAEVTADRKHLFVGHRGSWGITAAGNPQAKDLKPADAYGMRVKIEPLAEFRNIFNEMWRVNRDYFYDPGMHGVDWADPARPLPRHGMDGLRTRRRPPPLRRPG